MTKKRMKLIIEGTGTASWIYGEKKETFENLRKGLDMQTHVHIFWSHNHWALSYELRRI